MAEIASESCHYYYKDGRSCYEVEYADKKRKGEFRPTTLRDAKKLDLVPSVTTITRILAKPALDNWKQNQVLESAYTCPLKRDDVSAEEWMLRVKIDAEEQAKIARDNGTFIHGEIERYIKGQKVLPENEGKCIHTMNALLNYDISAEDIETEKSFATQYYGGKIDLLCRDKDFIADIKTTEFTLVDGVPFKNGKKAKLHYDEHILQLAGYGDAVLLAYPKHALNIFVSSIDGDDSVYVHEWNINEYMKASNRFQQLVKYWWDTNF